MKRPSFSNGLWIRVLEFGILPLVLGVGGGIALKWHGIVWLSDAGGFWPYVLVATSIGIAIRLAYGPYEDATSGVMAWLVLVAAWFYAPLWLAAVKVPTTAALVDGRGRVHVVRDEVRTVDPAVWLLTRTAGMRIVRNVSGKFESNGLDVTYAYAPPYVATRANGEDIEPPLVQAAAPLLAAVANANRTSKIAFLADRQAQDALLARICAGATGGAARCPIKLSIAPTQEAAALGGLWSSQYSEIEAIEEKHLASLVHLLTQTDVSLVKRDMVFALLLDLHPTGAALAQLAQKSQSLTDDQFDQVIARLLSCAGEDCGDAAAVIASVNRLGEPQRRLLRAKAVDEAKLSALLVNAAALRLSDGEIARFAPRVRIALRSEPSLAVRALDTFGERLPGEAQRDAVEGLLDAKPAYALAALERLNFAPELRQLLIRKVVADGSLDDFANARVNKTKLLEMLTPQELRALIEVSVKRGEGSERWHAFVVESLPVSGMTSEERHRIVNGLVFASPKSALEYVSKNREFLDQGEVAEVTRDYSRTVNRDFCLHLSHRNKNWKQNFFSEAQLQIFRDCAAGK